MKKSFWMFCMLLVSLGMAAQSLDGNWSLDADSRKRMGLEDEKLEMTLMLTFTPTGTVSKAVDADIPKGSQQGDFSVSMPVVGADDEIGTLGVAFTVDGTYYCNVNRVKTVCNSKDVEVKIIELEPKDPQMKSMMASGEKARDMIYAMLEAEVKKNSKDEISRIGELAVLFKDFTISFSGKDKLTVAVGDEKLGFERLK
jgi:hypothetical protein